MSNLQKYQYPMSYLLTAAKSWTKFGVSTESFLSLVGIEEERKQLENAKFNGEELKRLCALGHSLNVTGIPDSIMVAEQFSFTNVGLLGVAVTAAENFKQVLDLLMDYCPLIFPGLKITHAIDGYDLYVDYVFDPEFSDALPFLNEVVICVMKRFADLFADRLIAQRVILSHLPEYPLSVYSTFMECPVYCADEATTINRIQFKTPDLLRGLVHADKSTLAMIQQQMQQSLEKQQPTDTWGARAKSLWLEFIARGEFLNQTQMADQLHMSSRTLVRKLSEEGATYRELVNQWRLEKAKQILTETSLPITEIAEKIGFKDESAFFRFFKQSTGQTPRHYRHSC